MDSARWCLLAELHFVKLLCDLTRQSQLELNWDNGKENGNYYNGLYKVCIGIFLGEYRVIYSGFQFQA